jgi:hypothetical protein
MSWVDLRWTLPLIHKALTAKLATTILEYYVIWPQTREILVALTGWIECCHNSKDF